MNQSKLWCLAVLTGLSLLAGCQGENVDPFRVDPLRIVRDEQGRVRSVGGFGRPSAAIEIRDLNTMLGRTAVDNEGRWTFNYDFEQRKYHIVVAELNADGKAVARYGQYYLKGYSATSVLEPESAQEEEKQESTPAPEPSAPTFAIVSPSSGDLVKAGRLKVSGTAPARSEMIVYVNNRVVGRARANRLGQWMLFAEVEKGPVTISLLPREKGKRGSVVSLSAE